jgi:sugar phosphate isomerase/epimerase
MVPSAGEEDTALTERAGYLVGLGYDGWPVERVVESLAEIGYRWCEWSLHHYTLGDPRTLRQLRSTTESGGLCISELIAQQDFVTESPDLWEDRVVRTENAIRDAAAAGIATVNVLSGPNLWEPGALQVPSQIPVALAWDRVWSAFDRVVPLAQREGVTLAFEACWGTVCDDYFTTAQLLSRYDSAVLAVNLDPSHYVLRRQPIDWVVRQWGTRIRHVHVKDVIGEPGMEGDTFMFPLIGEGRTEWDAFFGALAEVGYVGPLSVEFESYRYYDQVLGSQPERAAHLGLQGLTAVWNRYRATAGQGR